MMEIVVQTPTRVVLALCLILLIENSTQELKELSLGDHKLCSDITKRKIGYESFLVTQGRANHHPIPWETPDICKFEVQSAYSRGGVVAVIQKLQLRRNFTSGECIDYIQFRSRKGASSQRHCGFLDARVVMNYNVDNAPESVFPEFFPISYGNSFIDVDGGMDVIIYVAKQALVVNERTEFSIVFTSYKDCSKVHHYKHIVLKECEENHKLKICINQSYFHDGYINCPHFGCLDEGGCLLSMKPEGKASVGDTVIIASVTVLGIVFAVFIMVIWLFRKHMMFCWSEEFAHPSPASESSRNSRVMEMNEQTGARLAENQCSTTVQATAPTPEEEKDLPPSYESLFPNAAPPR